MMFEFHKPANCPARRLLPAAALLGCSSKKENEANTNDVKSSIQANANKSCGVKLDADE
jgi:hypothetical protein